MKVLAALALTVSLAVPAISVAAPAKKGLPAKGKIAACLAQKQCFKTGKACFGRIREANKAKLQSLKGLSARKNFLKGLPGWKTCRTEMKSCRASCGVKGKR